MKSEGSCYSIDDLKKDGRTAWEGVRNFQARNFMERDMKVGDMVLFYHSSSNPSGVYGLAKVVSAAHADLSALDPKDEHYDPKSTKEKPIWTCVDVGFVEKFKEPLSLGQIKLRPKLSCMIILRKGSRLSITPVSKSEFEDVLKAAGSAIL